MALCSLLVLAAFPAHAAAPQGMMIAAASDLKFPLDEIISRYMRIHPDRKVLAVYGSSGKFVAQLLQGAPYDMVFSANMDYLHDLDRRGYSAHGVIPYAVGRLALWGRGREVTLADLFSPNTTRVVIANPQHAPYGMRAMEFLQASGRLDQVRGKLVYGENVAQAAQLAASGNADLGIISLSLALSSELSGQGSHVLIPDGLHQSLQQGYMITRRAAKNYTAEDFARYLWHPDAQAIMKRYGFTFIK